MLCFTLIPPSNMQICSPNLFLNYYIFIIILMKCYHDTNYQHWPYQDSESTGRATSKNFISPNHNDQIWFGKKLLETAVSTAVLIIIINLSLFIICFSSVAKIFPVKPSNALDLLKSESINCR
jgi:hypothetical protein